MVGRDLETDADVDRAGEEIVNRLECDGVLMTLGEDGMCLFERSGARTRIPTIAQEVFDVAGAGDTVIATFTLALASGAKMAEAARLANYAAGIVVGKLGVAVVTPKELCARLVAGDTARGPHTPGANDGESPAGRGRVGWRRGRTRHTTRRSSSSS